MDENLKELEFGDRIVFDRSEKTFSSSFLHSDENASSSFMYSIPS